MKPTAKDIIEYLKNNFSHVTFTYKNNTCGIDPFCTDNIQLWYGDKTATATSFNDVMNSPFFDSEAFLDIFDKIENVEY